MADRAGSRTAVVIPCYNEATVIGDTLAGVFERFDLVVCVDDGSSDGTRQAIEATRAHLVAHPVNLGQGAALQTGIDYALSLPGVAHIATYDADGQHEIGDVARMVEVLEAEDLDVVLGSRFLGEARDISRGKQLLLRAAIRFTNLFSGVKLTDTHNGLRVLSRSFAEDLEITMPDMAHASEIIDEIGRGGWRYREVPITIHYTDYSRAKGQSMFNAVNILFDLLLSKKRRA